MNEPLNGHKPLSMMIKPQPDPLRRKSHQIVDSKGFIIATSEEPLEMLKIELGKQHAVMDPNRECYIIDEDRQIIHTEGSYYVEPEDGPPDERRRELRDKWMDNVLRFLLQKNPRLCEHRNDPQWQDRIRKWLIAQKMEIEMRPDGGAVRVWRDGVVLCSWGC